VVTGKSKDSRRIIKCTFRGATFHKCNGRNHYARCCSKSKNGTQERRVHLVEEEEHENNEVLEGLYIEKKKNKFKVAPEGTFSPIYLLMTLP